MKVARVQRLFFALMWIEIAVSIISLYLFGAVADDSHGGSAGFWIGIVALMFGPPLVVGATFLALFGVENHIKDSIGFAFSMFILMILTTVAIAIKPDGMLHGARRIVHGSASGTVAEVSTSNAAWVDISPAYIDTTRIGKAHDTTTNSKGQSSTRYRVVAPILTAHGEADPTLTAERVAMFVCVSDGDDLLDSSNGTISGRMYPADSLELRAMKEANVANRVDKPMCVVPGRGASTFWFVLWIAIILVGATGGALTLTSFTSGISPRSPKS